MTSNRDIAKFVQAAQQRLQAPLDRYYKVVNEFGADSIQATIAQSITRVDMERAVRQNHIEAAVLGNAGTDLSDSARQAVQKIIAQDQAYMARFMRELPTIPQGAASVRADMYASTAKDTVSQIAAYDLPVTLPVYPKDEDALECGWHCRCRLDVRYLFGSGNADVYWRLDPLGREHCIDCRNLAAKWRPLKIRNGQIVGMKMVSDHDLHILEHVLKSLSERVA